MNASQIGMDVDRSNSLAVQRDPSEQLKSIRPELRAVFLQLRGGNASPCSASQVLDEDFPAFTVNARGDDVRPGVQSVQHIFGCIGIVKGESRCAVGANHLGERGEVTSQGLPGGEKVIADEPAAGQRQRSARSQKYDHLQLSFNG